MTEDGSNKSLLNIKRMYIDEEGWPTLDLTEKLLQHIA